MKLPIPAQGFTTISGKRKPPRSWGDELHCQLRDGTVDPYGKPWPVKTTDFIWKWLDAEKKVFEARNCDIIAVRKAD